ncbi:MAG TPA: CBS domain-containing protein [Planctomycetes bacterium]|nr:CBS domain-containing protein [Planctomycetota bacterium]
MKRKHWGDKGSPGPERERAVVHVEDLMVRQVITVTRHQSAGHARDLMREHRVHAIPVVDHGTHDGEPIGVISATDLIDDVKDESLIGQVMTDHVYTVSPYAAPHIAARMMRKHHIHHLVVTHEQRVVGMLSSFDLLRLVEDKRFTMKNLPSAPKKKTWERRKGEE